MPATVTRKTSREVLTHHLTGDRPMRLVFAIPDYPWAPLSKAASVRVAVTVVERGPANGQGRLLAICPTIKPAGRDTPLGYPRLRETWGDIAPDLTIGLDIARTAVLKANEGIASRGVQANGAGFVVEAETAARLFARSAPNSASPVKAYRNGRDLAEMPRGVQIIDFFGWDEDRVRREHPGFHDHLMTTVKSERAKNGRARYRRDWWLFSEPRKGLRTALQGLDRYIVTLETGKHRWFGFLDAAIMADNRLVCVASDDPFILGVLSSRAHGTWSRAAGGFLEDRPIYTKTACFDRFAFPEPKPALRIAIGAVAEALDRARAGLLERWPDMTMTRLYNDLDGTEGGCGGPGGRQAEISRIRWLHAEIDDLVAASYGWPADISDEDILSNLIALNRRRSEEETAGRIAWLRPEFQVRTAGAPIRPSSRLVASLSGAGVAILRPMPTRLAVAPRRPTGGETWPERRAGP